MKMFRTSSLYISLFMLAAIMLLAACDGQETAPAEETVAEEPAPAEETVAEETAAEQVEAITLVTNIPDGELSDDLIANFEAENPGITIERVENDVAKINAMIAAGTPPDVLRLSAFDLPLYTNQGLLLDITDRLAASDVIDTDDLVPAAGYFVIDGRNYGLPKDWSPDFSVFIDAQAFDDAGLEVPSSDQPFTYEKLGEYARALTIVDGDRTLQVGWHFSGTGFERMLSLWLLEQGQSLYSDDFTEAHIGNNAEAVEMLRFFYDLAQDGAIWTPTNPAPSGRTFLDGQSAMQSYGYWFGGSINGNPDAPVSGHVVMLPAPSWTGEARYNPTWGPTGVVIAADSPNPDAAFRFFEWFTAEEPALARFSSGWGVPIFETKFDLMPNETEFQQQALDLVISELEASDVVIPINPYYSPSVFTQSWETHLTEALNDNISFEELVENLESDVNMAIQDGLLASQ